MIHLPTADLAEIQQALSRFPTLQQAIIFGSCVKGTPKRGSDVDLAIELTPYNYADLLQIKDTLEEQTRLPYFFDVVELNHIQNTALKEHIQRAGQVIFPPEQKSP